MINAITGSKSHLPIHLRRTKDRTFDRIWKYYYMTGNQVILTKKQEAIRERWEYAWHMDLTLLGKWKIAKRLIKKFGIGQTQAFKDVKMARMLFSDPTTKNKDAKAAIMSHLLEQMIRKAVAKQDFKAAEKLILRYDKINGLSANEENPLIEMMKKQRPVAIIFDTNPETLRKQGDEMIADVIDTGYEEMNETEEKALLP